MTAVLQWAVPASAAEAAPTAAMPVKVMIITMFAPEAAPWLAKLPFDRSYRVPGLSAEFPLFGARRAAFAS